MSRGSVELEPEVAQLLRELPDEQFGQAMFYIDLLQERGVLLDEPYTRQLRGKLRELRFFIDSAPVRPSYFIGTGRRIIMLTAFRKTRQRETAEIERAERAMRRCLFEGHTAEDDAP